jgi:site-specific DNA recombinase
VYCRYSSERQRATSIEDQLALCRDAASRFHCEILEEHIYNDSEISGATDHRLAYQALLKAAKAREVDAILVESQDRLWRSQEEMHYALARLRFWRIKVYPVSTGTDLTDKAGNLIASVTAWKDSIYLQDLADKTRRGLAGQIRRGFSGGGRPYGYRSEPVFDESGKTVGHRRVVDHAEATVVCRILTMYCDGLGDPLIVAGVHPSGFRLFTGRGGATCSALRVRAI